MALNSSGQISLGGSVTGESVAVELSLSPTAQISLNDAVVRTLFGVSSGAIDMNTGHGKSDIFYFNLTSSTDANLRSAALAAGWNGSSAVVATVPTGNTIKSSSTSGYALTIDGTFPKGVKLINNGLIVGKGGLGGQGVNGFNSGSATVSPPAQTPTFNGGAGGTALTVTVATSIDNTNGRIAGGGGGGGGGGMGWWSGGVGSGGGGGGGGIGEGSGGSAGVSTGDPATGGVGSAGTTSTSGSGGSGYYHAYPPYVTSSGAGGAGGGYGQAGSAGGTGGGSTGGSYGGSGGAAGACLTGNSNITWIANGTRDGAIS